MLDKFSSKSKLAMHPTLLPQLNAHYKTIKHILSANFKFICSIILAIFITSFRLQITKVLTFFLPLVISTIACSVPIYLFIVSEKKMSKEVIFLEAERAGLRLVQIFNEANSSVYEGQMEAGCFLQKSERESTDCGVDEERERTIFAGRVEVKNDQGLFDEVLASLKVDCLAAGLWNNYFEGCSKWSYTGSENLEINHLYSI
ncbi:hypothetical protein LUZ61_013859 [Rhynchospora tenuis]|uniref:Uncharacterized protein n=1 Tax=Rhynchospora tenuis TaxID=198213 RepID=A0AAD5Z0L5_9POAL|nr:hypothetical protein LUZ61_013859 [Rhynchospora tenuis]